MDIYYQDRNLIVTYLQIFLKDNVGAVVRKVTPRSKSIKPYYEISSNEEIKVTGYWTPQSYSALALYMAYNYPNEGYPLKWTKTELDGSVVWKSEDYVYDDNQDELVSIIGSNLEDYSYAKASSSRSERTDLLYVPGRVLSYIFNEVVSSLSSPSEILRIKKMLYPSIYADSLHKNPLSYGEDLFNDVIKIQQSWVDRYTLSWSTSTDEYVVEEEGTNKIKLETQLVKVIPKTVGRVIDTDSSKDAYYKFNQNKAALVITLPSDNLLKVQVYGTDKSGAVKLEVVDDTSKFIYDKNTEEFLVNLDSSFISVSEVVVDYVVLSSYCAPTGELKFATPLSKGQVIYIDKTSHTYLNLPDGYEGFKVTGYVDPWTEKLIKRERGVNVI